MKFSLVVFVSLCAVALSSPVHEHKVADKAYMQKQKQVLQLLRYVQHKSHEPEHLTIGNTFSVNEHVDYYTKPEVVKAFVQHYKYGMLQRGEIFSVYNKEHLQQAVALFKLFYYAKDWESFHQTAVWARQHLNQGMFVYAYSVAVIHRPDSHRVMLPPIYEVYPNYFFSSEVINKAEYYKQVHTEKDPEHKDTVHTIESNYSGWYLNLHPEQSMSYYLEDVGINAFYYYYNLYYPSWMSSEEFGWKDTKRGELYYYFYQQVLARFYLERLSNGLGEVPYLNWDVPVETPYTPSLMYPNGLEFPSRPKFANLYEYFYNYGQSWVSQIYGYSHSFIQDYERRINDAIDSGFIISETGKLVNINTEEGLNVLGNIIQANADSPNFKYYGPLWVFARHLLGYSTQPLDQHKLVPSALEHFETSMRDPVFYQMVKKMILKFQRYYAHKPSYVEKELVLPGVKITDLEVDPLVTYFDYFYSSLRSAVFYNSHENAESFRARVRQFRLNHKPFTYKVHVKSDEVQKVSVKVFLGPKYDEYGRHINLTENRLNMVELEHFEYDLKSGENVITRQSHENQFYAPDRMSGHDMWTNLLAAQQGNGVYTIHPRQNYFSFPQRYMLPKGTTGGMTYQIVVMVYPYVPFHGHAEHEHEEHDLYKPGTGEIFVDNRSAGFPFDRHIKFEKMWYQIPNVYFHDEKIYHKEVHEINAPHH